MCSHFGYELEGNFKVIGENRYPFAWQDTEKCDTFFLTIEGRALDPRLGAVRSGAIDEGLDWVRVQKGR
jgi:hypothetical protein